MASSWFSHHILDSGLPVLVAPTSSPSATVVLMVNIGSRDEPAQQAGISHFLEHFVFKGTVKYPTGREVMRAMDAIGAEHNAATSKEYTSYWVRSAAGKLEQAMDFLGEVVFRPQLPAKLMSREKGTILQEIAMYRDNPMSRVGMVFEDLIFGSGTPLGRDIIGTPRTVRSMMREQLVAYRQGWYHPGRMVLAVAGGVKAEEVFRLAQQHFGSPIAGGDSLKTGRPEDIKTSWHPTRRRIESRATDQVHLALGVRGLKRTDPRRYALSTMLTILGGNASSQLFDQIREQRGLAYYIRAGTVKFRDTGYVVVRAGVPPPKAALVRDVVAELLFGFRTSDQEVTEAKNYLKGHTALAWEESQEIAEHLAEEFFFESPAENDTSMRMAGVRSMEEMVRRLDAVTREQVEEVAREVFADPQQLYVAAVGPVDSRLKHRKA